MRHYSSTQFAVGTDAADAAEPAESGSDDGPAPVSRARRLGPTVLLTLCGILLVAAIAITTGLLVSNSHVRALAASERELGNTALLLAEHVDHEVRQLELVQNSLIEQMRSLGVASSADYARTMAGRDVHLMLKDMISALPHVSSIALIDSDGTLINDSYNWPIPAIDVTDRDYFKAFKSDAQLTWFVSEPVRGRRTGNWTILVVRKAAGPDGELLGLILGAIHLEHFEKFFETILLGERASISLQRRDGMLLVRYPRIEGTVGRIFTGVIDKLGQRDRGMVRLVGRMDGKDRLLAAHRLAHYPLMMTVGLDVDAALADWREETRFLIGAGSLAAVSVAVIFFFIVRQSLQGRRRSRRMLHEHKRRLDAALDNMSQGLVMFDTSERIVVCNRRYLEMYGLSPDVIRPGCTLRELLVHRQETGSFSGDIDRYQSELRAALAQGTTTDLVTEISDGRSIQIVNQPMADGGWVATHEDVTDKRRAAQQRDQDREFLNQLIDNVPVAIVVKDARDRRFVHVSRATEALWGLSRADAIGKTPHDLFPKARADLIAADDDKVLRSDTPLFVDQHQNLASADDGRILTSTKLAIRGADGEPKYLVSVIEDVTERRHAERERDRYREFLDLIVDNVPSPIFVKEALGRRYILVNQAAEKFWGRPRSEMLGTTVYDFFPQATAELIDGHDAQVLNSAGDLLLLNEHVIDTPGNGRRIVTSKRVVIRGEDGVPKYFLGVIEDVTEKRNAEIERDRSRNFLDRIIDSVPMAIFAKDVGERRVVLMNRAAEELWGISRAEALGKTPHELFAKSQADLISAADEALLKSGASLFVSEHRNLARADDDRIVTSQRLVMRDNDGKPQFLLSVIEDVTQRRATERQLQQAQKMEAVGNLTGGLAHDFNNLLMVVIGNLDLLQEDVADRPGAAQRVETILQASLRGADLTRQMLAFARRQPLRPRRIDIKDLVGNTTRLLQRTLGEDIRVELRTGADPCPVLVDESQMEAAVVNIAINARDAMPGGGTLTVAAANERLDGDRAARHPGARPGDYVCVEIGDTGAGMPQEVLARIFEPFFTTKGPGKGTGLGLSMVYGFIKQSGGYVDVASRVGEGTTFKLYLPRAAADEARSGAADGGPQPLPAANGEVILAVDDNPQVRATAVDHLREIGYRVLEADNARTALDQLDSDTAIDLLFTDIVMPGGMNGKQLAAAGRAKRPGLKVLFTSGFPGSVLGDDATLGAGETLLSKPYRKQDLARAVRDILHRP